MRAVFDTNIFVSALALPGGQAEKALLSAVEGRVELVVSKPIILEVLGVLARKFDRAQDELARVAVFLAEVGEVVQTRKAVAVLKDEPDNRILECALAGGAEVIVTGDRAMLALGTFEGIPIVSLRAFLEDIRK
ncbi:MAG: putative toxin-antitoxin system toxin component, PIN family [Burkholderiales bacterium]